MPVVNMSTPDYEIMKTDYDQLQHMSNRYHMWEDFAKVVGDHIETYTIPQYGDFPNDQISTWTVDELATNLKRYVSRIGRNSRGPEESILDMLKVAHYSCVIWHKMHNAEKVYN